MMRRPVTWPALALAAALAAALPAPAGAARRPAPPPVCNLVTDPPGDVSMPGVGANPNFYNSSLDVISADLATNAKELTMAIRVKQLQVPNSQAPLGMRWTLHFTIGAQLFTFTTSTSQVATNFPYGATKGTLDTARHEIRFTMPIKTLTDRVALPKGTVAKSFKVETGYYVTFDRTWLLGDGQFLYTAENAASERTYPMGAASCLKVGA